MEDDFKKICISYIEEVSRLKKMSISAIAQACKISPSTLTRMVSGDHSPRHDTMQKIEKWSKIPFRWNDGATKPEIYKEKLQDKPEEEDQKREEWLSFMKAVFHRLTPEAQEQLMDEAASLLAQQRAKKPSE